MGNEVETKTDATPVEKPVTSSTPEAKAPPEKPQGKEGQSTTSKVEAPKDDKATTEPKEGDAKAKPDAGTDDATKPDGAETKTDNDATGETKVVPEKYELTPPEHVFSDRQLKQFEENARKRGLSNEEAQAELEATAKTVQDEVQAQSEEWRKQSESDPEVGGAKLAENAEHAKRALKQFFPAGIVDHLNRTGMGNHPDVLKGLARIGKLLADDKLVTGGKPPTEPKSTAEKLYGSTSSGKG